MSIKISEMHDEYRICEFGNLNVGDCFLVDVDDTLLCSRIEYSSNYNAFVFENGSLINIALDRKVIPVDVYVDYQKQRLT